MKKPQLADSRTKWIAFAQEASLTEAQVDLFKRYYLILSAANQHTNLTTIIDEADVIDYHFKDSLQLSSVVDMATITHAVDIGTGGGFPGVALALKYPHLAVTLIEVNAKKIQFLDTLITQLDLGTRVAIFDEDWRTFLRTPYEKVQLFCARASLQPEELIRMFKPASPYKNEQLVYWASAIWEPSPTVASYIAKDVPYVIRNKTRRLILLHQKRAQAQ